MSTFTFEWHPEKSRKNLAKHGISFEEAKTVFSDSNALLINDPDHSEEEDRFVLLGFSASLNMLVVCHCYRSESETIRIISARRATKTETATYKGR